MLKRTISHLEGLRALLLVCRPAAPTAPLRCISDMYILPTQTPRDNGDTPIPPLRYVKNILGLTQMVCISTDPVGDTC